MLLYPGVLLAAFLVATVVAGCRDTEGNAQTEPTTPAVKAIKIGTETVTPTTIRDVIFLPGATEAAEDVRVAADIGGRVEWIGPSEGETVQAGALIAKIDASMLKAEVDRAEASFKLADELARRRQRLFSRKIITREELDRCEAECAVAAANLERARVNYEHGFVRAPIAGVINRKHVDAGEFVRAGEPVMDIVNVDRIKVCVNVPELDVRYLRVNQQTPVTVDALPEEHLTGTIEFIAFKADPATKTFRVRSVVENPAHRIRPGMIARVAFVKRVIPDALTVPLFALVDQGGERILFVEEDGTARARSAAIGVIEGDRVQVTGGIRAGDRVIVLGQTEVEDGMKVESR